MSGTRHRSNDPRLIDNAERIMADLAAHCEEETTLRELGRVGPGPGTRNECSAMDYLFSDGGFIEDEDSYAHDA